MTFPFYPNSGSSLVVPADTLHFVYDASGRMVRADNQWAQVSRSYYANGALSQEVQAIRSYGTPSFTTNVYTQTYKYDLGGRRIRHGLPFSTDSVTYAYDATTGALGEVRHGYDQAHFHLDLSGRLDSMDVRQNTTIGVTETRRYDADGQLTRLLRQRLSGGTYVNLLDDSLTYDARGKIRRVVLTSASVNVGQQTATVDYSGLGTVVAASKWNPIGTQWETEEFRASATGTTYWTHMAAGSLASRHAQRTRFGANGQVELKEPLPPGSEPNYLDNVDNRYDGAGNVTQSTTQFQYQSGSSGRYYAATRWYYGAGNRPMVAQRYYTSDAGGLAGAWEEFRYDALGRRVLSRTRRGAHGSIYVQLCASTCPGWIERTIWDGENILYEGRVQVADTSTVGSDLFSSTGLSWGSVGYVHAGGYDRPVFTLDGRVPSYNWRGLPESSVWTTGAVADCSLGGGACTTVAWPSANTIYLKPSPYGGGGSAPQWIGTVLADGVGSTGMLYRRNRYYDPASGQFTQEDPIGLAGGANLYGFAGGDPVNFGDPFGLCPFTGSEESCFQLLANWGASTGRSWAVTAGATLGAGGAIATAIEQALVGGGCDGGLSCGSVGFAGPAGESKLGPRPSIGSIKGALAEVHAEVGKLPKREPGKFGSPQRGTSQKGYRLDPGHPNRSAGDPEGGWHFNWWDWTEGKRGSGGRSGAVPIKPN